MSLFTVTILHSPISHHVLKYQDITYNSIITDYKAVSFLLCPSAQNVCHADSIQHPGHPVTATVLGDAIKGMLCKTQIFGSEDIHDDRFYSKSRLEAKQCKTTLFEAD